MATRYGRGYRRTRGYKRRYTRRRPYAKRRFRRYRRRTSTKSSVVKLTFEATWSLGTRQSSTMGYQWSPFQFTPSSIPGFKDYQTTYSHFRLLKAKLYMANHDFNDTTQQPTLNYLVVGSRPFAATTAPVTGTSTPAEYVPPQFESDLRQARWQRVHYPSRITSKISMSFIPYTMVATNGPAIGDPSKIWQRIWEGKRWMPFAWGYQSGYPALTFFGPYIVAQIPEGTDPDYNASSTSYPAHGTLELYVQFKGQK